MNYRIHTDAIRYHLVPQELSEDEITYIYADEADVLNKALFGLTAKQRKDQYPEKKREYEGFCNYRAVDCVGKSGECQRGIHQDENRTVQTYQDIESDSYQSDEVIDPTSKRCTLMGKVGC